MRGRVQLLGWCNTASRNNTAAGAAPAVLHTPDLEEEEVDWLK